MDKDEIRTSLLEGLRIGGQSVACKVTKKITKTNNGYRTKEERILPFETVKDFPLAYAYSKKYLTLEFREDYFEKLMDEYHLFLEEKYIYRTVCYLPNLILDVPVELPTGFKIMPVDEQSLNLLCSEDLIHFNHKPLWQDFSDPFNATIIVYEQVVEETYDINRNELRHRLENILKSIILSNGISPSFEIKLAYTFSYFGSSSTTMYFPELTTHNNLGKSSRKIRLNSPEEISSFYELLVKVGTTPLAVKRYISAFTKASEDDKIIDLVIALESLYPSVKSENTYRISILTALALGEGIAMYKKVKALYDYRSGIVHGNNQRSKITLGEANIIVKKTLHYYLEELAKGKKLEDVEDELTQQIFGGRMEISAGFFSQ